MRFLFKSSILFTAIFLASCSVQKVPSWQLNAAINIQKAMENNLAGNTRLAKIEFNKAQKEISSTGRIDLMAKLELSKCAANISVLDFDDINACKSAEKYISDDNEQAYLKYLSGEFAGDKKLLPPQYQADNIKEINSPISKMIAAAVIYKQGGIDEDIIKFAIDTARNQGWRLALSQWLKVYIKTLENNEGNKKLLEDLNLQLEIVNFKKD